MQQGQRGFTLIEIAIVLVVIGLLLGGILKGQEMITQGKIRSIEKELDGIAVAVLGYQDRYKALPGDDSGAKGRWPDAADGDADGNLEGAFNSITTDDESRTLWNHLRRSGLISGAADSQEQPANAIGGKTGIQNNLSDGTKTLITGLVVCTTNLPAKIANSIDAQRDDGNPDKGSILGFGQSAVNTPDFSTATTAYVDDGSKSYTLCKAI